VAHQAWSAAACEAGDLHRFEAGEGAAVVLPLAQHGDPRQSRLGAFQYQKFEQLAVVAARHAPFAVVIVAVQRVVTAPGAALDGIHGVLRVGQLPVYYSRRIAHHRCSTIPSIAKPRPRCEPSTPPFAPTWFAVLRWRRPTNCTWRSAGPRRGSPWCSSTAAPGVAAG